MKNKHWMMLVAVAAFGLAACGGDAGGSDSASNMDDTAGQMADDAADDGGEMANGAADDGSDAMSQELPEGVTMAMVEQGDQVFHGAGICATCHGADGQGLPNLGGNLTDEEWIHSDGSYEGIVQTIMSGVTADESTVGVPMPAKGGANISDEQVRAAAAYVWTLSK